MTKPDPALEIVRDVRKQISHAFDNDPKRLVEHYMKSQVKFAGRMIAEVTVHEEKTSGTGTAEDRP